MKKQLHQIGSDKSLKQRTELLRRFAAVERNKALEEAALLADAYEYGALIAAKIRNLKTKVA